MEQNKCDGCYYFDGEYCLFFQVNYECRPIVPKNERGECEHYAERDTDSVD